MWVLYYKNEKRVAQLVTQLQDRVLTKELEKTKKKTEAGINATGEGKVGFLATASAKANFGLERSSGDESDIHREYSINTDDVNLKKVLVYFDTDVPSINQQLNQKEDDIPNLIKFTGNCFPLVSGDTFVQRMIKYKETSELQWLCSLNSLKIIFVTRKESIVSDTIMSYVLMKEEGSLLLDVVGTVVSKAPAKIEILPIIIGTNF
jgi:hypothetical protein